MTVGNQCEACVHVAKRHGPKDEMANRVCLRMGCLILDFCGANCGGAYYEEHTDNVEQVAVLEVEV